jgi:hypothetical protein
MPSGFFRQVSVRNRTRLVDGLDVVPRDAVRVADIADRQLLGLGDDGQLRHAPDI